MLSVRRVKAANGGAQVIAGVMHSERAQAHSGASHGMFSE